MKKKKVKKAIRTLYDLGSRFEARAERAIAALIKKLRKKKRNAEKESHVYGSLFHMALWLIRRRGPGQDPAP